MRLNAKNEAKISMSIGSRATYFYIKNVRKWMFCPACKNGKMTFDRKILKWTCKDCGYNFSERYFLDDCVFWFCDECETYLNNQDGFNPKATKHICRICGYENDTTFSNVKDVCLDCGVVLPDINATLCENCKQVRRERAKQWLKVASEVAVVAGTTILAATAIRDDDVTSSDTSFSDEYDDNKDEFAINTWQNNVDGIIETDYCQGCIYHSVYPIEGKTYEVCQIWGRNGCHIGCDRKETTPRFRWTDANRWDND